MSYEAEPDGVGKGGVCRAGAGPAALAKRGLAQRGLATHAPRARDDAGEERDDSMRLEGRTALVTGGGQGFGEGIAERFAREGARVAVVDLDARRAERVASRIGNGSVGLQADVARAADVHRCVRQAITAFGHLDVLVNNAGISHRNRPMLEVEEEEFDRLYAVNVKSIYLTALEVVPHFRERGRGVILNIGSTAGIRPRPGLTWYNGTKGAVNLLTKSMAVELAPDRIRVVAIAPVAGETPLLATFMGEDTPERRAAFKATIPLGRLSTPEDIANAALFLVSDEAGMVTGAVVEVDGGRCI